MFDKYTLQYNNQISKVKKKLALLVVRNNYAELDWILPILYKIKNKYKIITFFQSKKIYEKFSNENISLFKKWDKINYYHFFPPLFSSLLIIFLRLFAIN